MLPLPNIPNLARDLRLLWQQVPAGRVTTYGNLAAALGSAAASRWVGQYAKDHAHAADCVCHRIVRATGELGTYTTGDLAEKQRRLTMEGALNDQGRADLIRCRFEHFTTEKPLIGLAEYQRQAAGQIRLTCEAQTYHRLGGIDVSYADGQVGVASYVLMQTTTRKVVWTDTIRRAAPFPYISGFLAFRELPIMLESIERARAAGRLADVVFVDGSGILHPRRSGIASMLGVAADVPTIGITKKLLCGRVTGDLPVATASQPIRFEDEVLGFALRPPGGPRKPLFVSPGHLIDVSTAAELVSQQCWQRRLPEPIYWADRLSRQAARESRAEHPNSQL